MGLRPPRISARPLPKVTGSPTPLDESRSFALLSKAGLPCVSTILVEAGDTLSELPFPYPVVAKGITPGVTHKTERGLVRLDLADAAALQAAIDALLVLPDCARVLIAPLVRGVGEVLLGFRRDPVVGPVVMLSPGGVLAELYDDRAVRTAPVDEATARELLAELPGLKPLTGYRNLPRGDVDALAAAIVTLSQLAAADNPAIHEAEINPLIVRASGEGVVAVDALVITA
jgi:succinyl-CoA synthetase beta subunit